MRLLIATVIMLSSSALALSQIEPTGRQGGAPAPPAPSAPKSRYQRDESAREDRTTGGMIERGEFAAGEPDIKVTVDVPAFRLTLWQNGREVKTYRVGVGMKKYPLAIGERRVEQIIWNPDWIPPDSEWVGERAGVSVGEVIKASDPRNPLGKMKMPLGGGYLIHEAHGPADLGNLVSHGCVRMLRSDLYDLSEKIVAARSLPVSAKKIANAKRTKNTVVARLDDPLVVDVNYDTHVVEGGVLHLYSDVYGRGTNTVDQLRAELEEYGVDPAAADDATLKKMLALPTRQRQYVVSLESVKAGRALEDGRLLPVLPAPAPAKKKALAARKTARPA
ncbi:MAG TPA: L,D-transpeptidase [Pyrinomonadaceae bacterium]|jgi:lipoprotein-anchoring transpeptidase ErfK/SrfK|nr:L,D-transpeptidase [Pyrinomonadaceae bacterium]